MFDKVKQHMKDHKEAYIVGALGTGLAVGTWFVIGGRHAVVGNAASDGPVKVTMRPLSFFSKQTNNVVSVIEREGRGHPGYIVRCLETNELFSTQGEAARKFEVDSTIMSRHMRGILTDVNGFHFERLGKIIA